MINTAPLWKSGNDLTTHYKHWFLGYFSIQRKHPFCAIRPQVFRLLLNVQDPPFHRSKDISNNTTCTLVFLHLAVVNMQKQIKKKPTSLLKMKIHTS